MKLINELPKGSGLTVIWFQTLGYWYSTSLLLRGRVVEGVSHRQFATLAQGAVALMSWMST